MPGRSTSGRTPKRGQLTTGKTSTEERLKDLLFYALVILLIYLSYLVFTPFLVSLAWAAVLVVVTYPAHERLAKRLGRNSGALVSTIAVTLILIVPAIFVLIAFVRQAVGAVQSVQLGFAAGHYAWVNRLWQHLQSRFPQLASTDLGSLLQQYAERGAAYAAQRLGAILRNSFEFIADVSFTILGMFYFFRDGHLIARRLRRALPFEPDQQDRLVDDTHELIFATVTSSLAAAAVHGIIGTLAFALTGIKGPLFWGTIMGFFSFIPLVGTALIWVPLSLSLALNGHWVSGIILAVICSLIVGTIDNIVRPLMISGRAEMSTLLIFVGVLGGIRVFGLLGVVLGPIVIAMARTLLDFYVPSGRRGNSEPQSGGHAENVVLE